MPLFPSEVVQAVCGSINFRCDYIFPFVKINALSELNFAYKVSIKFSLSFSLITSSSFDIKNRQNLKKKRVQEERKEIYVSSPRRQFFFIGVHFNLEKQFIIFTMLIL